MRVLSSPGRTSAAAGRGFSLVGENQTFRQESVPPRCIREFETPATTVGPSNGMHRVYEKTVVGWDGSAPADAAVSWAVERVGERRNSVQIVRVVDSAALNAEELDTRWAVAVATFALAELTARLRTAHPGLEVTGAVVRGEPGEVLSEYSGADSLIVIGGQHGHTDEYWFSSRWGARLAAIVDGAVAVIPVRDSRRRSGVVAGIGGADEPVSIGVFAAELAYLRGEELHLVYACPDRPAGSETAFQDADDAVLDRVLVPIRQAFPTLPVYRHIEHASPASALLLRARDASVVVVGTRRPGIARRLFLGSVSHTLVNNARCPTIVVAKVADAPA
jgi:nucleotide-binding universal stress UspA family protein